MEPLNEGENQFEGDEHCVKYKIPLSCRAQRVMNVINCVFFKCASANLGEFPSLLSLKLSLSWLKAAWKSGSEEGSPAREHLLQLVFICRLMRWELFMPGDTQRNFRRRFIDESIRKCCKQVPTRVKRKWNVVAQLIGLPEPVISTRRLLTSICGLLL